MERMLRLIGFWNRLPVFRVVAETEHLPTASKRLGLTAPALSRSIKLLEESVGRPLFDREGRRIVLNPTGRAFLQVVRTAMRQVDTALDELQEVGLSGEIRISSAGMFTPLAIAATVALIRDHPGLRPKLTHLWDSAVNEALLHGDLDVALLQHPEPHPELRIEGLATCPYGVFCGRGHPLWDADEVTEADLSAHSFVAPPPSGSGLPSDGWPARLDRTVSMHIIQVEVAVRVCASGALLSVLPVPVVAGGAYRDRLRRLPVAIIAASTLHVVTRRPLATATSRSAGEVVVDAIRNALEGSNFEPSSTSN